MPEKSNPWENRIVGYFEKPAKDFKFNPLNWRTHGELQKKAISEVLEGIGWVTGVIENRNTENLIDGHARIEEALRKGEDTPVPYLLVDLSEDEERKILAVLDPIGAMAGSDAEKIAELTEQLRMENGVLADIVAQLNTTSVDLEDFWEEKKSGSIVTEKFTINLEFDSRADFEATLARLKEIDDDPAVAVRKLLEE